MRFADAPAPVPQLARADEIQAFEHALDAARPASGPDVAVLGRGKLLAALAPAARPGLVFKRLPPFPSETARTRYARALDAYRLMLAERVGLDLPPQQSVHAEDAAGAPLLYVVQERLPRGAFVDALLPHLDDHEAARLLGTVATATLRVWHRNAIDGPTGWTGLDARLDNWAVRAVEDVLTLRYVDTAVPLVRRAGQDLLAPEVFLQTIPAPLVRYFRPRLHDALLERYDVRIALLDVVASLHGGGQAHRVALAVALVNRLLETEENAELFVDPLTPGEVAAHHARSAGFWRRFHAAGRAARFTRTTLFRQPFPSVLPE